MPRLVRYFSPMPRHRKAPYPQWRTEIEAGLAADRPGELARLLNSAALLFAEHHWRAAALDCLHAQFVLADDDALATGGDLDALVNLVRLSMTAQAGGEGVLGFWLDALSGRETRDDLNWLWLRASRWREEVVDTLVQDSLRTERFIHRGRLLDAAASAAPGLPEQSRTLRQEYLRRSDATGKIGNETEVFARVVTPLIDGADEETHAGEAAVRACHGLQIMADHIDGTWWRAVAATAADLPATPAWLHDRMAAFLKSEPLLANLLPAPIARRFVDLAQLRNDRLAPGDLRALQRSISARLATFAGLSDRVAHYAAIWRLRLEAPITVTGASGDSA